MQENTRLLSKTLHIYQENSLMMGASPEQKQQCLFSTLEEMLNPKHPLYLLSRKMPWEQLEKYFQNNYSSKGRRAKPVRLMISLLLLKQMYDLGDETVISQWIQNPYFQFLSGEKTFRWEFPCDPSDLVHFRNRIKEDGVKKIFQVSIELHGKTAQEKTLIADTTVQEKNITFPTDMKLHCKVIGKCKSIARKENIPLRQTYTRTVKTLILEQRFKRQPKGKKKALRAQRKLRTIAARLCRELESKLSEVNRNTYLKDLTLFKRVLEQKRTDHNKIYSLHEPDVYCISKGKEHKKYEFGSKVSILATKNSGIIVGALSFEKNEYDGHTLPAALEQYRNLMNKEATEIIADRGYKGKKIIGQTVVAIPGKHKNFKTQYEKRKVRMKFRRRASIEPIIGHLKVDTGLGRNYLKGVKGDKMNVMLAAAAYNIRKWMRIIFVSIMKLLLLMQNSLTLRNDQLLKLSF
jgi:IS5 family transposase